MCCLRATLPLCYFAGMASVFDIRRANLRLLMRQWGGPASLAAKLGHSNGSYLAQLAGPHPSRDVSEKTARGIEQALGLTPSWMDRAHKAPPNEPDTSALIDVMALVQDMLDAEKVKLPRAKFSELAALAYELAQEVGPASVEWTRRIIHLLK